jgi:hypothetical protein
VCVVSTNAAFIKRDFCDPLLGGWKIFAVYLHIIYTNTRYIKATNAR